MPKFAAHRPQARTRFGITTLLRTGLVCAMAVGATACSMQQPEGELPGLAGVAVQLERAYSGLEYKVLQIDGFRIPYLEGGSGEPLVLIHGFGGSKDNFNRVAKSLTSRYKVYAIDLPGFGGTNRDLQADYSIQKQAERVHDIVARLGLERPHMGGNSMGGAIATAYAAKYPQEVGSLWLLAPGGTRGGEQSEVRQHYARTGEVMLIATNLAEYQRLLDLVMFKKPAFAPEFVLKAMAQRSKNDQALHLKIFQSFGKTPFYGADALAESPYPGPAMIVWGKQDRVLHVDGAAELKRALPQAKVVIMDETGHVPQMERPDEVAAQYMAWRDTLVVQTAAR